VNAAYVVETGNTGIAFKGGTEEKIHVFIKVDQNSLCHDSSYPKFILVWPRNFHKYSKHNKLCCCKYEFINVMFERLVSAGLNINLNRLYASFYAKSTIYEHLK